MKPFHLFPLLLLSVVAVRSYTQGLPIKPTRTITFTTDEGTNIDIDVSPDGRTLAFDLLGDLYTVPANGGKATQLTRGIAINLHPKWSPDGTMIAYLGDTSGAFHLNVMDIKRTFHTVLGRDESDMIEYRDSNFVWTQDGRSIVVKGAAYGVAGGKVPMDSNIKQPIGFSTKGQTIYFCDPERRAGISFDMKIYGYDRESKSRTLISAINHAYTGVLSPDARWWCYYSDSNNNRCLLLTDLLKNETRMLVPKLLVQDPSFSKSGRFPHFSFSPDSKQIFIGYAGKIHRIDIESGNDAIVPFSADVKVDLGPLNYNTYQISDNAEQLKYIRSANVSPDGQHLVFSALNKIYVMDLPDGKPRVLVDQPVNQFQPVFSPDGKWVAYVSWDDSVGGHLWRVAATGGKPEQLTHLAHEYLYPAWSPDGAQIAVVKADPNFHNLRMIQSVKGALELVPVHGGDVRVAVDSLPVINSVAFSADGRRTIYTPWLLNGSWTEPQLVSKVPGEDSLHVIANSEKIPPYTQTSLSPDGRYIVFSAAEDLFLAPAAKTKEPPILLQEGEWVPTIRFATGIDPIWEKNGKVLAWTYGNRYYRVDPDRIMAQAEKVKDDHEQPKEREYSFVTAFVTPDETITIPVSVPQSYARGTIALKNVRILTMQGNKVIERGTIVIKDRRIVAAGPVSGVVIPPGAETLDLAGTTVMPGLIDLHFHIDAVSTIIPQQYRVLQSALAYGTTTIRDPSQHLVSYGYAELLNAGQMQGPRLYTVGEPVLSPHGALRMSSLEDAQHVVQKRLEMGSISVKNYLVGSTRLVREWLQIGCQQAGLNMTNEGDPDPIIDLAMIKDGNPGIEHNPQWQDVYKDYLTVFAQSGTFFTPTIQVMGGPDRGQGKLYFNYQYWRQPNQKMQRFSFSDPKQRPQVSNLESIEVITRNVPVNEGGRTSVFEAATVDARIRKMGGRVTLGSHGNDGGAGPQNELWALQWGGLTNMEALQAGTIMSAEALGLQRDLGSLEVGKIADLIVLNKNPLDDIHNSREIRYVMKDGILYDGDTLDEIWPEKKKCQLWREPSDPAKVRSLPTPPATGSARD